MESKKVTEQKFWGMNEKTFCVVMHLLAATQCFLILSPIMYFTNKEKSEFVDHHGKNLMNLLLTVIILSLVWNTIASILTFVIIGFFMYFLQPVLLLILAYVAAYKAYKGEKWDIPLTFKFFK